MKAVLQAAALGLATLLVVGVQFALVARTGFPMGDFRAFYCAARVVTQGADPYRTEPLHTCEGQSGLGAFFAKNHDVTVPAPLPGYVIGALVPLAKLPAPIAAAAWLLLLLGACVVSVVAMARFAAVSWSIPVSVLAFSVGVASIPFGETVPIAIATICAAGYSAWRGRWIAAGIASAVAMLEPHLGLPVCLSLFVWAPRTRLTLVVSAATLGTLSLVALGFATNIEYFATILPAHALSEAGRDTQYSLTSILASAGFADNVAVRGGLLSYFAMLVIGVISAGWLARNTSNAAFLACGPPAFAVFGGTFIHVTQIAVALPAAILLTQVTSGQRRAAAVIAVLLLCVPWIMAWSPAFGLVPAFPIGYLTWAYWSGNLRAVMLAVLVAGILVVGMNRALLDIAARPPATHIKTTINSSLPEASWSEFSDRSSNGSVGAWVVRIPTWGGLALLLGLLIAQAKMIAPRAVRGAIS